MDFSLALLELKSGRHLRRSGWNGKGMHIYLEEHSKYVIRGGVFSGSDRQYDPVVVMYTAQGTHQLGWLCSQADMLAEDWEVVTRE